MNYTYIELSNGKQLIVKSENDLQFTNLNPKNIYDYKELLTPNGASIMITRLDDKKVNPMYPKDTYYINKDLIVLQYSIDESSPIVSDGIKKADASAAGLTLV